MLDPGGALPGEHPSPKGWIGLCFQDLAGCSRARRSLLNNSLVSLNVHKLILSGILENDNSGESYGLKSGPAIFVPPRSQAASHPVCRLTADSTAAFST